MTTRRIIFWEPSVSPHKLALVRALIARGNDCIYVAQEGLPAERAAQGWALEGVDGIDIRIAPDDAEIAALIPAEPDQALHLFSGIRHVPVIVAALRRAMACRATFAIMSEPRARDGWGGRLRYLQSWLTEGAIRRSAAFVLAIGRNGPPWFTGVGYTRVFPFAYFLPPAPPPSPRGNRPPTILYLGRLTRPKGIGVFLDAIPLVRTPARWIVAGPGEEAERVQRDARVDYLGRIPMADVPALLDRIDVLVQPAKAKDGWAAVVSEALLAGAAAIATPHVGASILLQDPRLGAIAEATPADIAVAIDAVLQRPADDETRQARAAWAHGALSGDAGAARLLSIAAHVLDGGPPPPPFPPRFGPPATNRKDRP